MDPPNERELKNKHPTQIDFKYIIALKKIAGFTNEIIQKYICNNNNNNNNKHIKERYIEQARIFYENWFESFLSNRVFLNSLHTNAQNERYNLGSFIFLEICRLRFICYYDRILFEDEKVAEMTEKPESPQRYIILRSLASNKSDYWIDGNRDIWKKQIFSYTQKNVISCLFFLSQNIKNLKIEDETSIGEFQDFLLSLFLRNSSFFCQKADENILDVEDLRKLVDDEKYVPNFDYIYFCNTYFMSIERQFYYFRLLNKNMLLLYIDEKWVENLKAMVEKTLNQLNNESFIDMYASSCDKSYKFCGDDDWFSFKYPQKLNSRGIIIQSIRPELHAKYYAELHISKDTVKDTVDSNFVSRNFVLDILNNYFVVKEKIHWMKAVVIFSDDIEKSFIKIAKNEMPLLIELISIPQLYYKKRILNSDSIYTQIVGWMILLKRKFDSKLLGVDLSRFLNSILN